MLFRLLLASCLLFVLNGAKSQTAYNPFTQNIRFDPEPSVSGFACNQLVQVKFTFGMTTQDDANDWSLNPLKIHVLLEGFQFNSLTANDIEGSMKSYFNWSTNPLNPKEFIGTQNQSLPGTGTDPLNPNLNSSGEIRIALKVPASSPPSNILKVDVNLEIPNYMATFNTMLDDDESTQTQFYCGALSCSTPPQIKILPGKQFCIGDHVILKASGVPGANLQWSYPSSANVLLLDSTNTTSIIDLGSLNSSHSGWYIVTQTVPGCSISLKDSVWIDPQIKPAILSLNTTCNNGQAVVNILAQGSGLQYSINGGPFQFNNILSVNSGSTFQVGIRAADSNCMAFFEGLCVNCNSGTSCANAMSIQSNIPAISCLNQTILLQTNLTNVSGGFWSTQGDGIFDQTNCSGSTCNSAYLPGIQDKQKGYVVIGFESNDPDGLGPCESKQIYKTIFLIEEFIAPIISGQLSYCINEPLQLFAHTNSYQHGWISPSGTIWNDQEVTINQVQNQDEGFWTSIQQGASCLTRTDSVWVEINPQPVVQVSSQLQHELCAGQANGKIQINISGGSGNYLSYLNQQTANSQSGNNIVFSNLSAGTHTLSVQDLSCNAHLQTFIYTILPGTMIPTPQIGILPEYCEGETIVLQAQVASGYNVLWHCPNPYFQAIGNPVTIQAFNALSSGTFQVKTIDSNGCASAPVLFQLNIHAKPQIDSVIIVCDSLSLIANVQIQSTLSNGHLSYSLDGVQFQSQPNFSQVPAGLYTVYVRNGQSFCMDSLPIQVKNCACSINNNLLVQHPFIACGLNGFPLLATFSQNGIGSWSTNGSGNFGSINHQTNSSQATYYPSSTDLQVGFVVLSFTLSDPDGNGPCDSSIQYAKIFLRDSLSQPQIISHGALCQNDTLNLETNLNPLPVEWKRNAQVLESSKAALHIAAVQSNDAAWYHISISGFACNSYQDSLFVQVNQAPILNKQIQVSHEICAGQGNGQVVLELNGGSGQYMVKNDLGQLQQGNTPFVFKWLPSGQHLFYIADSSCRNFWIDTSIVLQPGMITPPVDSVSHQSSYCQGDSIILSAHGLSGDFEWTTPFGHFSGQSIQIANAELMHSGNYQVKRLTNGCASAPISIPIQVMPIPSIQQIDTFCDAEGGRMSIVAPVISEFSQEYSIQPGIWSADSFFHHLSNGIYPVQARISGSACYSEMEQIILNCDCHCNKEAPIEIFPNPNQGDFFVQFKLNEPVIMASVRILDYNGQLIYQKLFEPQGLMIQERVNLPTHKSGLYFLQIQLDDLVFNRPLYIER